MEQIEKTGAEAIGNQVLLEAGVRSNSRSSPPLPWLCICPELPQNLKSGIPSLGKIWKRPLILDGD